MKQKLLDLIEKVFDYDNVMIILFLCLIALLFTPVIGLGFIIAYLFGIV